MSTGKVYGSSRLHTHAQQLPIVPSSNLTQPIPTSAGVHRVLGLRSRNHSKSKSPSPYGNGRGHELNELLETLLKCSRSRQMKRAWSVAHPNGFG